jgi:glucan phosphoethanolaminetransferase (alkaline phosphatase superfamily)
MKRHLTILTIVLVTVCILLVLTPLSLYGCYTNTIFFFLTVCLIILTIVRRIKKKLNKLITGLFAFCILLIGFFIYNDIDFHQWGFVHRGTVESIENANKQSNFIISTVYYQVNEFDKMGPEECRYWEKKTIKFFPIFEWTVRES